MPQTEKQTNSFISKCLENKGFKYNFTNETSKWSPSEKVRKTDYYRTGDCRYIAVVVNNPIKKISPNLIISDAKSGSLPYDSTTPSSSNTIFQGVVKNDNELEFLLNLLGI